MKTTTLFQLGGIAVLVAAILYGISNLMYYLSGQPDAPTELGLWVVIVADTLLLLGLGALFARKSQRAGILGLVGYVLLVVAQVYFFGNYAVTLGMTAGVISSEQTAQVPVYVVANSIMPWIWTAGLVVFGISIYRAQVFPKYAGALLVILAVVQQFTGPLAITRPIFAVVSFAAWAWLGWALFSDQNPISQESIPATGGRLASGPAEN